MEKLKPFNLAECIAGKPVVTRDGCEYKFGAYNEEAVGDEKLIGWTKVKDGRWESITHTEKGVFIFDSKSDDNLFMAPIEQTYYMNIYNNYGLINNSSFFSSEKEAKDNIIGTGKFLKTIEVKLTV